MRRTRAAVKAALIAEEDLVQLETTKPATKRRRKAVPSNAKCVAEKENLDLIGTSNATGVSDQNASNETLDVEVLRADAEGLDLPLDSPPESDIITLDDDDDALKSVPIRVAPPSRQATGLRRGGKGKTNAASVSEKSSASSSTQQISVLDVVEISSGTSSGSSSPLLLEEVSSCGSSYVTNSTSSPKHSLSQSPSESSNPKKIAAVKPEISTSKSTSSQKNPTGNEMFTGIIVGAQLKLKKNKRLTTEEILRMNMADSIGAASLANTLKPSRKPTKKAEEPYNFKKALDKLVPDELIRTATTVSANQIDLDRPLTARQAEIADLDTDTDVEAIEEEEVPVRTKNLKTKSQLNGLKYPQPATASRSRPDRLNELNDEYANFQERMESGTQSTLQDECIILGDETFSPLQSPAIPVRPRPSQRPPQEKWQEGITKMTIRVTYKSRSYTFNVTKDWDVAKLRRILADRIGKEVDRVHIYSKNDEGMRDGRSLGSYEVEHCDVLEASVHEVAKIPISEQPPEDVVKLKFQKQGLKKPIIINLLKSTNFREIQLMVAKELQIDISTVRFIFDGESVALTETPESLGMDDDDCIDIHES